MIINHIVIHCSATKPDVDIGVKEIRKWHKAKKPPWDDIGYHIVYRLNGHREFGRPFDVPGAHVYGYNHKSLGLCYIGGYDAEGYAKDTRTPEQIESMLGDIRILKAAHRNAKVSGHRDFSPDLNSDGIITPEEYIKDCPCFDAIKEYQDV